MGAYYNEDRIDEHLQRWHFIVWIFVKVATPVVIAAFGWMIQNSINNQAASSQLVAQAMQILSSPDAPAASRRWAVETVNRYSPVKIEEDFVPTIPAEVVSDWFNENMRSGEGGFILDGEGQIRFLGPGLRMPDTEKRDQ
jgi:hypothetical protein